MTHSTLHRAGLGAALAMAMSGCARDPMPSARSGSPHAKMAFDPARDRCGVTVVDTAAVKACMRAQGWIYRLPWE